MLQKLCSSKRFCLFLFFFPAKFGFWFSVFGFWIVHKSRVTKIKTGVSILGFGFFGHKSKIPNTQTGIPSLGFGSLVKIAKSQEPERAFHLRVLGLWPKVPNPRNPEANVDDPSAPGGRFRHTKPSLDRVADYYKHRALDSPVCSPLVRGRGAPPPLPRIPDVGSRI